jgi:hypothetical protein
MSDDETPFTPGADAEAGAREQKERETPGEKPTGGKLIRADVFLSRLAERQRAERNFAEDESSVIETILGAFEDMGLDPILAAPGFTTTPLADTQEENADPDADSTSPSLEDMAVEELFLSELSAGRRPSLSAYTRRYPAQRDALLRLAAHMDPRALAGLDTSEAITPEQEAAAWEGQEEGTRRGLEMTMKRRSQRGATRRVAEERASYTAGKPDDAGDGKTKRKRARSARSEKPKDEPGPER